ncbi:MAG: M24 family metallopeptidase [Gemmatimonadetes bacterium]|nr:M24 family metallopeptidase [Gemmatimonadota bacterium]
MTDVPLLIDPDGVERVQAALAEHGLDGWLLFEFRGQNWISAALLGAGWTTRRTYALIPRVGRPKALIHAIEGSSWRHWPWDVEQYAGWREMETRLAELVDGRTRLAVEFSPGAAVPTVDLVPAGTLELLRGAGVEPVSSGDLVSRFFSAWSPAQLEDHRRTAEIVAEVGKGAFAEAERALRAGEAPTEGSITRWILGRLERAGVTVDVDTHVAVGARAADPHYAPEGEGEAIEPGQVLLVDLWGRTSEDAVSADQTWMAWLGPQAPDRVVDLWTIVRDSRDAGVRLLEDRAAAGARIMGYEVDDACRAVIDDAGFGDYFIHRTGHSIDRKLHGSGPNLDNLETRDIRRIIPGVGFSIEPGIYIPGDVGLRSEINAHFGEDGPEVTPREPQTDLILLDV